LVSVASSPLIANSSEWLYRSGINDKHDALIQRDYILENYDSSDKIGIVYINNDYGVAIKNILEEELKLEGYSIETESFNFGTSDFRTIINKFKNRDVKVISFVGYPENSPIFLRQIIELDFNGKILGSMGTISDEFFKLENEDLTKNYLVVFFGKMELEDTIFYSRFKERYGMSPTVYSDFAFDSMLVIGKLLEQGEISKNSFENVFIENAATGYIGFDNLREREGLETSLARFERGKLICEFGC
jgi:branched-chain amino acid transport system substrate-binding protein